MSKLRQIGLSILLLSLGSFSSSLSAHILGSDDRVPMLSEALPWSAIGRLTIGDNKICTATLVGRDLILTAAHCLLDQDTNKSIHLDQVVTFSPSLKEGKAYHHAQVVSAWLGTFEPQSQPWQDYAFARLSEPLGEIYGTLAIKSFSGSDLSQSRPEIVSLPGYSTDFHEAQTAGVHLNCAIRDRLYEDEKVKLLSHDCDMKIGASGAPLLSFIGAEASIIGVNIAERNFVNNVSILLGLPATYNPRTTANIAVSTDRMMGLFQILTQSIYGATRNY
jgi:protease YdgD